MLLEKLLAFALVEGAMAISPGPAVLLVCATALRAGFRTSLAATAGILSANLFAFALSAMGLGMLVSASPEAFLLLRRAGALYLLWLAQEAWRSGGVFRVREEGGGRRAGDAYRRAVLLQMSNPKAILVFVTIVPPFVDMDLPVWPQMASLAAVSVSLELVVLAAYGYTVSRMAARLADERWVRRVERGAAALLLVAACLAWA